MHYSLGEFISQISYSKDNIFRLKFCKIQSRIQFARQWKIHYSPLITFHKRKSKSEYTKNDAIIQINQYYWICIREKKKYFSAGFTSETAKLSKKQFSAYQPLPNFLTVSNKVSRICQRLEVHFEIFQNFSFLSKEKNCQKFSQKGIFWNLASKYPFSTFLK